jgi:hypothetical protein
MDKPSKIEMAQNLVKDLAEEGKQILQGTERISDEDKERRLNICRVCQFFKADSMRCAKCGCFMKFKAGLRSVSCPIGRWGPPQGCIVIDKEGN